MKVVALAFLLLVVSVLATFAISLLLFWAGELGIGIVGIETLAKAGLCFSYIDSVAMSVLFIATGITSINMEQYPPAPAAYWILFFRRAMVRGREAKLVGVRLLVLGMLFAFVMIYALTHFQFFWSKLSEIA